MLGRLDSKVRILYSERNRKVSTPAIFLDRDGVLNYRRPNDYVLDWSQFEFVQGIRSAISKLALLQLPLIVISNQSAVGRGLLPPSALKDITARLHAALLEDGAFVDAFYYCTHHPDSKCACRKPSPQMLLEAAYDFGINLRRSVFIGDSDTDVLAARSAGCIPILFGIEVSKLQKSPEWNRTIPIVTDANDLCRVVHRLLCQH